MADFLVEANKTVNAFVWGMPAIVAIVGVVWDVADTFNLKPAVEPRSF